MSIVTQPAPCRRPRPGRRGHPSEPIAKAPTIAAPPITQNTIRTTGHLLQQPDHIRPEDRADPADTQFHANAAGTQQGLV